MKLSLSNILTGILVILACVGLGFYFGGASKETTIDKFKKELAVVQDSAKKVLQINAALEISRDSILALNKERDDSIAARDKKIAELRTKARSQDIALGNLAARNDSLLKNLEPRMDSATKELVSGLHEQIDSLENRVETAKAETKEQEKQTLDWKAKAENFEAAKNLAEIRAANAEQSLNDIINLPAPKDPDKLFGLIKLPSRTTTFFIGAAVGAVVTGVTAVAAN